MTTMRSLPGRWVAAVALALAATLLGLSGTSVFAVTKTPWNTNLVKNPGFEAGAASSNGYEVVAIPHWLSSASSPNAGTVVRYGQSGWPTVHEGNRINGGHKFWASGLYANGECPDAVQRIQIKNRAAAIDAGDVVVTLSAWMATYDSQIDEVEVAIVFRSAGPSFQSLGTAFLYESQSHSVFVKQTKHVFVPGHTRYIDVQLVGLSHEGDYCDHYVDKVSVKIQHL